MNREPVDFKHADAVQIPSDWESIKLDDVAKRGSGHTPDKKHPEYWNGDIKWVSLRDSDALDRFFISDTAASITRAGIANSSAVVHPAGTVILSRDAGIGKSAILETSMAVSQHFIAWQSGPRLDNVFLYYWLQFAKPEFERIAMGSTIKTIGLPYFQSLRIPLPPLQEQRAVGSTLRKVDECLATLDALISKERDLKQAALQGFLTGHRRLPGFRRDWLTAPLRSFVREFIVPMRDKPKRFGGHIPWCRIEDFDGKFLVTSRTSQFVNADTIREMNLKVFPAGTLMVSCSADLGRCAIAGAPLVSNQTFIGLVFDEAQASNEFFYYYLGFRADQLNQLSSGTTISYLARDQFEAFEVHVPEDMQEQKEIAAMLSALDESIQALEARRDKVCAMKQGMMQQLLTGRIRLI